MANRTANYTAFYVAEPASESNLAANATKDFVYYRQLQAWKGQDSSFPFVDAHNKTYNVRDDSDWEKTLKPRLHERLNTSKNIILFLSSITRSSKALKEEMEYGIANQGLPVIVVYPDFSEKSDIVDSNGYFKKQIKDLWNLLPSFKNHMGEVATIHIPMKKSIIEDALCNKNYMKNTMTNPGAHYYKP